MYEKTLAWWKEKKIETDAQLAEVLNGHSIAFAYHSGKIENNSFLNNLDKVFPVKDSLKKGYYHHMKLNDNSISLELLFTGVNFDVQLFEEDC